MKVYLILLALTALVTFALTPAVRALGIRGEVFTPRRKREAAA